MADRMFRLTRLIQSTIILLTVCLTLSCAVKTTRRSIRSADPIKIQDIRVAEGVDKTIVELESEAPILYTSFRLSDPDRLVIEMADVAFGRYEDEIKVAEGPIRFIRLASSGTLDVSRLEFELDGLVKTEVRPEGLNIIIEVTRLEKVTGLGRTPQVELKNKGRFIFFADEQNKAPDEGPDKPEVMETTKALPVPQSEDSPAPSAEVSNDQVMTKAPDGKVLSTEKTEKETAVASPAKIVSAVRLVEGEVLQLVVTSDGRLSPDIFFVGRDKGRLVIDLPGVKSKMKQNRLPGDAFFVKQIRFGQHPKKFRIVLDLNRGVAFTWDQKENELWMTLK